MPCGVVVLFLKERRATLALEEKREDERTDRKNLRHCLAEHDGFVNDVLTEFRAWAPVGGCRRDGLRLEIQGWRVLGWLALGLCGIFLGRRGVRTAALYFARMEKRKKALS